MFGGGVKILCPVLEMFVWTQNSRQKENAFGTSQYINRDWIKKNWIQGCPKWM